MGAMKQWQIEQMERCGCGQAFSKLHDEDHPDKCCVCGSCIDAEEPDEVTETFLQLEFQFPEPTEDGS